MTPRTMRRIGKGAALALTVTLGLAAAATTLARDQQTITGVIKPSEISRGVVKVCYLKTEDGKKFLILNNEKGKQLLTQTKSTVRATGYIRKPNMDKGFEQIIDIVEYEIVNPTPEATDTTETAAKTESDSD